MHALPMTEMKKFTEKQLLTRWDQHYKQLGLWGRSSTSGCIKIFTFQVTLLKEMLDSGNEEGKQKRNGKVKSSTQSRVANKLPTKKFLSFTSFFNKKNRKNFIKGNINKENDSCSICDGCSTPNSRTVGGVTTSFKLIGKQGSSGHLIRVPSKILTTRKKLRVARSLRKKMNKQFERGSEEENDAKIKKRTVSWYYARRGFQWERSAGLLVFLVPFGMIKVTFCYQRSLVRIIGEVPSSLVRS